MVSWIGGRQVALPYERDARFAGTTKYPLRKMINFALDAITSFSTTPLRIATWLGMISAGVAMALLVYTFVRWLQGETVTGWSSIMAAVSAFSAIQLICIGIIGEYLGRLVQESKRRPMFMIETILRGSERAELPTAFSEMGAGDKRAALDAAFAPGEARSKKNSRAG
jgi:dolichol-phosphate mannosyltransferase